MTSLAYEIREYWVPAGVQFSHLVDSLIKVCKEDQVVAKFLFNNREYKVYPWSTQGELLKQFEEKR